MIHILDRKTAPIPPFTPRHRAERAPLGARLAGETPSQLTSNQLAQAHLIAVRDGATGLYHLIKCRAQRHGSGMNQGDVINAEALQHLVRLTLEEFAS